MSDAVKHLWGVDFDYYYLLRELLDLRSKNPPEQERTGTGMTEVFGYSTKFDVAAEFPILSLKKTHWKSVLVELLWFLRGGTNIKFLRDNGVTIWDEWATTDGELGPVYGKQWRSWVGADGRTHDQIAEMVNTIKKNPKSRRNLVSAWNVGELDKMSLQPCHVLFQANVGATGKLNLAVYQRSVDVFLGMPFNWASYAALLMILAKVGGKDVGELSYFAGSVHLYENHIEQAKLACSRFEAFVEEMSPGVYEPIEPIAPQLVVSDRVAKVADLADLELSDFKLRNYDPYDVIKADVAV